MINKLRKWPVVLEVLTVLAVAAVPAHAGVPLSSLIPAGSVTSGNLTFSNFFYSSTGDMPAATGVNVNVIPGGIEFQGAFLSLPGDSSDAFISYTVTVNSGTGATGASMSGNPAIIGGTGSMSVTDTFTPSDPATMSIFSDVPGSTVNSNSVTFAGPLLTFDAQKDIEGVGGPLTNGGGIASLSFVDQTYGGTVPEPTSILLMGFGAVGLVGYVWRKR